MIDILFIAVMQAAIGDPQPVIAENDQPAAVVAAEAAPDDSAPESVRERRARHRIRCRDQAVIGSRMSNRVCMSQADEEEMQEESRDIAHRMQRSGAWDGTLPTGP